MSLNELTDDLAQLLNTAEGSAIQGPALEAGKPAFDRIEPRGAGGRKVQRDARVSCQPGPHFSGLMCGTVIQNHMQIQFGGRVAFDLAHEVEKLTGAMALGDASHDLARDDVKGCVQTGGAMALVVVGTTFNLPGAQRQLRLCASSPTRHTPWPRSAEKVLSPARYKATGVGGITPVASKRRHPRRRLVFAANDSSQDGRKTFESLC